MTDEQTNREIITCANHPDVQANVQCKICKKRICPKCLVENRRDMICKRCHDLLFQPHIDAKRATARDTANSATGIAVRPPFGITIVGVFFLVMSVYVLLTIDNSVVHGSIYFFGGIISGHTALAVQLASLGVTLYLGMGFLQGWPRVWIVSVVFLALMALNFFMIFVVPGAVERFGSTLPARSQEVTRATVYSYFLLQILVFLWLLRYIYRLKSFFLKRDLSGPPKDR